MLNHLLQLVEMNRVFSAAFSLVPRSWDVAPG